MTIQQTLLRDAMQSLNMTRDVFAERLAIKRRTLDTWLLPDNSNEFRAMPGVVEKFIQEILRTDSQNQKYTQSAHGNDLASRIAYNGKPQLISVEQFSRESVEELLAIAEMMEPIARRQKITRVLEGAVLGNLFFEASTRTRVSFGTAFCRLGGSVCDTTGFTFSSMAKGESIYDTSRVMSGYVDAMVVRHPDKGSVAEFAEATNIPVINGGDGPGEHPSQALLDLYTIRKEFARLDKQIDGAHIALVGDLKYGRTVHSLIKLLSLYRGIKFSLVAPTVLEMPSNIMDLVASRGHTLIQSQSLREGLQDVDVLYATRIQKERFAGEEIEGYSSDLQVTREMLDSACNPDTFVMHPLPRDSRAGANDLSTDLNHDPRLAIFRQTDNGIPVRMAIFAVLLGVEGQIQGSMRDACWKSPTHIGPHDAIFHRLQNG
ncbi:MAG TPA: aspartate carbamoyltransferase [Burkholderiaceae bacterium]|jgi:aspartate carbamoyltransferase catalytic subunit|nr:aspartate carbamoyltransferase [Burkholderiaceae bacterium]